MRIGFARDRIVVVRAPLRRDEYGNEIPDWAAATRTEVADCLVRPLPGDEDTVDRDAVVTRWRLLAPAGADLLATDRVEYAGAVYEVTGPVLVWRSATGGLDHQECVLQTVEG